MTIILTTHYLDEADEADQLYIIDHGKVIAQGSAAEIKSEYASNLLKICFKISRWRNSYLKICLWKRKMSLSIVFILRANWKLLII